MKLILLIALTILCGAASASVIPVNPVTTTYAVTGTPVVTAHSHQVVARQFNRVYVPTISTVPTTYTTTGVAYPGYSTAWGTTYPYAYRPSYGYGYGYGYGYPHGYTYPYGTSVW